ncbi:MAG: acetolactate synthase small subunit [Deltaproteobacteria bacterium]|nr:acetolactate synthase small subunit [Deltaproteobacteria bacterium]
MKMDTRKLTISVFTENEIGLLHRVTVVFTRRKLNIDSITASNSEIPGLYRYTIVLTTTRRIAERVVDQLEKQVEVIKALVHEEEEIIHQEIALYKVSTESLIKGDPIEDLVRQANARILVMNGDFVVIEKTGHPEETTGLYNRLAPHGIMEFARSGRVAITRPTKMLRDHIAELAAKYKNEKGGVSW